MKKILVIQQKMIGDVLLSSILCQYLKRKYPKSEIHYCIYAHTLPVVLNNPYVDRIISFEPEHKENKRAFLKFLRNIRSQHYDSVIDAYGKMESNLITLFSGAKYRVSYHKWYTRCIYTKTVKRRPTVYTNAGNALEDRLRLVMDESEISENIIAPVLYLSDLERNNAKLFLKEHGLNLNRPIVMISVLGSNKKKSLPPEIMAELLNKIVEQTHAQLLFNYIPEQMDEARAIYNLTSEETKNDIFFDVYGKSLRDFMAILSQCNALIGNEGGAVNMAKALDLPTFTIFSPWISKGAWNLFEDDHKHLSVHLKDFEPQWYNNKDPKELKGDCEFLYHKMKPEYMLPKLARFLSEHVTL